MALRESGVVLGRQRPCTPCRGYGARGGGIAGSSYLEAVPHLGDARDHGPSGEHGGEGPRLRPTVSPPRSAFRRRPGMKLPKSRAKNEDRAVKGASFPRIFRQV